MIKRLLVFTLMMLQVLCLTAQVANQPSFSTAGFYLSERDTGREVYSFNQGWYFHRGDLADAGSAAVNAEDWQPVNLPHGVDGALPENASGGKNYQGVAWYKKFFKVPSSLQKKVFHLHFEGIMGKSEIWVNGKFVMRHEGGYLPVILPLDASLVSFDAENTIAIKADNSDDDSYPPGKPQYSLDFSYFGGIYRDAWLVGTNAVHISDAMSENVVAGGGVFAHFENISENEATVIVQTQIRRESQTSSRYRLKTFLVDARDQKVGSMESTFAFVENEAVSLTHKMKIKKPQLWSPDRPHLYKLYTEVYDNKGKLVDGYYNRVGIRSIEFREKEGFFLNGKHFEDKLMGFNHHQDYAYIGNAMPNNLQWRDVKKLKEAGAKVIRLAHYPHDPAFMDACDELGIFVIVPTPGWQYFNKDSSFAAKVIDNNRRMVRRDRNHPSVLAWEPILNETYYTEEFAKSAYESIHEEYPFPGAAAACDINTPYWEHFDLVYAHARDKKGPELTTKPLFTREYGDFVDDWNTHNSSSRVYRGWGEVPQLIQAWHYASEPLGDDDIESIYESVPQHVGGALWHAFDHNRGYHPDPFYGGIMDAFRQPKTSFYLYETQQKSLTSAADCQVHIAHEMTPFSPADVTVFTNCDSVKLTYLNQQSQTLVVDHASHHMPFAPLLFKNVFHFPQQKVMAMGGKWDQIQLVAEGFIDGKLVTTEVKTPARRPTKIKLVADLDGMMPAADGGSIIPIFAYVTDDQGVIKRLNEETIGFSVTGEGELIGDELTGANPKKVSWGSAPALIRTTNVAGKITVMAAPLFSGAQTAHSDTLVIETTAAPFQAVTQPWKFETNHLKTVSSVYPQVREKQDEETIRKELKQVEKDQKDFQNKLKKTER